jgi:phosphoglycolate phosphatase
VEDIEIRFEAILFDLDGTLLDTLEDLADSFNTALKQLGFPVHPVDCYRYFTGQGIIGLATNALPEGYRDDAIIEKVLSFAREQYQNCWADNTKPYEGIPEMLTELERRDIIKVVLSNKPDEFTQLIVKKLLGKWSFDIVRGENPTTPIKPDPTAALQIANRLKIPPQNFIYLGDTNTDMWTAQAAGMYPVGALWGFRPEELTNAGAKTLIKTPLDLLKLLDAV